ncbi:unnamed protein product [marine sediment metagenome]|uniref:Coenzyme Q-binding protein COQ10 START domain-containing protein n=1 Tax=marine sediment metagenome TaxID=412755 RepID=X0T643_9ZZZZ
MATVERTISINAPVEKVFDYISEATNGPEFIPSQVEVEYVIRTEEGVGSRYRWVYKLLGIRFEGQSECTEYVPNERIVTETKGGIVSTWTYTFEPEDGGTKLTLVVDYTIPIPVLGRFAEALVLRQNEREADLAMANLKAIMEA